jgi:hypothetical protein
LSYDYGVKYERYLSRWNPRSRPSDAWSPGHGDVSAFVNEAVRQQLQVQRLQRLLAEMDEEFGAVSEAIAREVDAVAWSTVNGVADS